MKRGARNLASYTCREMDEALNLLLALARIVYATDKNSASGFAGLLTFETRVSGVSIDYEYIRFARPNVWLLLHQLFQD